MWDSSVVIVVAVAVPIVLLSVVLTWFVRRRVLANGILDRPNLRSSHSVPTPRGGGLAIVVASIIGIAALWLIGVVDGRLVLALVGGGTAIAWIGFKDDRSSVSPGQRFVVHAAAAVWAVCILGGLPPIQMDERVIYLGLTGDVIGTVAVIWVLNLFNFMDGIDGIAASEAIFVTGAAAFLALIAGRGTSVPAASLVVAAASAGFLAWNWPPAKIFMGDVGSGYLGYLIAVLALGAAREDPVALYVWLVLGALFFVDATATLVRRLVRRERVYEAHRSHAYQWLSRRWSSHKHVTLLLWAINLAWLLPMAWLCAKYPTRAFLIVGIALMALAPLVLVAGAGRAEAQDA